ncbi:Siderophore transporter RhtX family [Penicillium odoratum]|uniref:Siderophore transporter RhtX family n=1 Tax=Penicillium odoratum TaxID=1167516 RepID=UPI002548C36F|nr:Siderophore transporter RhtX family [Penicillium odoratum]KAJ5761265.1 Siderophore transporter RhtX family [Penicillium odoratum]
MSSQSETASQNTNKDLDQPSASDTKIGSQSQSEYDCTEKKDVPSASAPSNPDPEAEQQQCRKRKPLSFFLAFIALLLMVFLVSLDSTTLAVAIPVNIPTCRDPSTNQLTYLFSLNRLTSDLSGTTLTAFWANISFTVAVVVIQPIYISFSDIFGRKIPLYRAFTLFAIGSIVFSVAHSMAVLIVGRVLQGLGGGGLDVLTEVIVADITTLQERAIYIGLLSLPMAAGCIAGPILGAVFSEYVTWRWIGWINLPVIGVAFFLAFFFVRLKPIDQSLRSQLSRIDWFGMLLFTAGSILFALPLSWAGNMYPWGSWRTIVPLIIGIFILVGFAFYEAYPADAMFPYRIFRSRTAQMTLLGSSTHGFVLYTLLQYLSFFSQAAYLETPLKSSISILLFCCVVYVFTGIAAFAVDVLRRYKWEIWAGWVFLAVGCGIFSPWDQSSSVAKTAGFQVIAGIGIGTIFSVPPIPMQASAAAEDQGLARGIMVGFRLSGSLIGLAVGGTTFSSVFAKGIDGIALPASVALLADPSEAVGFIPHLRTVDIPPALRVLIKEAYKNAMQTIWYEMAAFGALGFLSSLFIEELTMETEEMGRQHYEH